MADIRIKDLATLESASLTGDVFVIDGTTGTRKLSAFSPTFGGNATVTGTLTVNGTGLSQMTGDTNSRLEVGSSTVDQRAHIGLVQRLNLGNPIFSKNLAGKASSDAYTTIGTTAGAGYSGIEFGFGGVIKLLNGTGATTANAEVTPTISLDTNTTRVNIPLTTASTTTSSGALVVGNGTSGGLGVGGNITLGGGVNIAGAASDPLPAGTSGLWTLSGSGLRINSAGYTFASLVGNSASTAAFTLNGTTASTSTSSGALVVSGGVGVAGAINAGGAVTVAGGSFAAASFYKSASLGTVLSGATGSSYDLYLTNPAGNYVMQVPTGTRNAEFAATLTTVGAITSGASISTSAPVGGAGAWELGTYSSTAPSATGYVTIEIGGTVYKLLASNV